jgi:putative ABC transport system permease protein
MIRHIATLVWNRKRRNALLLLEIVCAFMVLVAVVVFGLHAFRNTQGTVGFNRTDVWDLEVGRPESSTSRDAQAVADQPIVLAMLAELRQMSAVAGVGGAFTGPYVNSQWGSRLFLKDGRRVRFSSNRVTDGFLDVMQMKLVEGRWFTREDDVTAWDAVVLNKRLATEIFGQRSAVGQTIDEQVDSAQLAPGDPAPKPKRVVGVVEEFRQLGELATPENYLFYRMHVDRPAPAAGASAAGRGDDIPPHVFLRMAPGTTAAFEEALLRRLTAIAPDWSFRVRPVEASRRETNSAFAIPIGGLGLVAVSLLLMVALGLTGVLWQSITQRTREFGLRRAAGATATSVQNQVLLELLTLGTVAMIIGVGIVAQIAMLPRPGDFPAVAQSTIILGVVLSIATIYLVMFLCGWYPSRLATRVPPAEALHYE